MNKLSTVLLVDKENEGSFVLKYKYKLRFDVSGRITLSW